MRNLKRYLLFTALVYAVAILSGGKPFFAWFDAWIGVFVDKPKRRVYLFMLPMLGIQYQLISTPKSELKLYRVIRQNEDYTYAEDKEGRLIVYRTNPYFYGGDFFDKDTQFIE